MDTYEGNGPRPAYLGLRGDRLIWGVTFFATMGFSVSVCTVPREFSRLTIEVAILQLFGYDQGLMSGIISSPQFNGEFPETASSGPDDVHAGTIRGTVTGRFPSSSIRPVPCV